MRGRRIVQNILSNWVALAVTTIVGFFLAPFIVHRLGNVAYGVWILVVSLTSYMNLLDLGLRGAVMRFVSKGYARGDHAEANEAVSGALWIRLWISLAIVLASVLFAVVFPRVFAAPATMHQQARLAILVTAATVALSLWCGVFGGVLAALHRYDLLSAVTMVQTTFRAAGICWLLLHGHGILALALWDLATAVVANGLLVVLSFHSYPRLRISLRIPGKAVVAKLWTYSLYAFLINVAVQVAYYTDNLVVGAFTSASAVTFYAIGGTLIGYARQIVSSVTTTFTPLASSFEAQGLENDLRRLLVHGTRAALIVSLPIEAALFLRGHTFIRLWMGAQYAHPSGTVLQILLLSLIVSSANTTSGGIVYGMEKHKRVALWAVLEAAANLGLSIFLVRRIGINGVAWGTTIPSLIVEFVLWPPYICKLVGMEVRTYLWQTWIRTFLAVLPFSLACYFCELYWPSHNLRIFFLQIATVFPLFPVALALTFRTEVATQWRRRFPKSAAALSVRHEYESSATSAR
jgi:O-antigen/teichoic acid export membrane protein